MTTEHIRLAFSMARNEVAQAATCQRNCEAAEVDGEGAVWIEGPMRGHWMNDDELVTLAEWIEAETGQTLDKWVGMVCNA